MKQHYSVAYKEERGTVKFCVKRQESYTLKKGDHLKNMSFND